MSKFIVIKKANKGASSGTASISIRFDIDKSILCTLINEPSGYKLVLFRGTEESYPRTYFQEGVILDPQTDFISNTDFTFDTNNKEGGTKNWFYVEMRTSGDVTVAISNIIAITVF